MTQGREVVGVASSASMGEIADLRGVRRRPRVEGKRQDPHHVAKRCALIEPLPDLGVAKRQGDEGDRQPDRQAAVDLLPSGVGR